MIVVPLIPVALTVLALALLLLLGAWRIVFSLWRGGELPPVGERLQDWSRAYPFWSYSVAALLGALLGHFYLQGPASP